MRRSLTTEEFKIRVYEEVQEEYEVLGEYTKASNKIKMKHNKCGHEWDVIASGFINNGTRCPKCNLSNRALSADEFKKEVHELVGDEYEVLGEYVNRNTHIKIKHNKCGNEWDIKPWVFKRGVRCPKCSKFTKIEHDEFVRRAYDLNKGLFEIIGEYKNIRSSIKIKSLKCGHVYETPALNLLKKKEGLICPICAKKRKTTR